MVHSNRYCCCIWYVNKNQAWTILAFFNQYNTRAPVLQYNTITIPMQYWLFVAHACPVFDLFNLLFSYYPSFHHTEWVEEHIVGQKANFDLQNWTSVIYR